MNHVEMLRKAEAFVQAHLPELCRDLQELNATGRLPDGSLRELHGMCTFVSGSESTLRYAERLIEYAAISALSAKPTHRNISASPELATKESLVTCDCGCGRSCCANCGVDVGFVTDKPEGEAVATVGRHWGGGAIGFDLNDFREPLPPYGTRLYDHPPRTHGVVMDETMAWESFLSSLNFGERQTVIDSASRGESLTRKAFEAGMKVYPPHLHGVVVDKAMVDRFCEVYSETVPEDCLGIVRRNAIRAGLVATSLFESKKELTGLSYNQIFGAIAAATRVQGNAVGVSVKAFLAEIGSPSIYAHVPCSTEKSNGT